MADNKSRYEIIQIVSSQSGIIKVLQYKMKSFGMLIALILGFM